MENSNAENAETQLTERVEGQENHTEDNYRQEIEDIVRGFIIEKDILAQSHEEEINHMKRRFDLERKQLLKQLEMDKEQMIEASRITDSVATAHDVNFAVSDAFVSDAGRMQSFFNSSAEGHRFVSGYHRRSNGAHDIDEVDSNLIREIAEVYLRINNGALTSQMRPELDLEDKYEREREALERSFHLEKRELKRILEEECYRKLEQERIKYEASIADLKTTISELQWQKREAENRVRHEKEKWEMNIEREKNETEKRHLQLVQETRKKVEDKHSSELQKQRDRYEENISDLQTDISKLTIQLKELNENLSQEKEIIMSKFEREVKEMEQAFLEQRNSLKANFEAEFMMRLENETSLLKTLNIKLKEDLENMEKDKKDVERRGKEERRKLEERFEEEISEMEQTQSEEKRALKIKLEERYQLGLVREKGGLEETIQELSEEIALLKQENAQMEITFAERRDELQRQLDIEREDMRRKAISDREEIRVRVENELSQKLMLEKVTQDDAFRYHERDALIIQAKYDDLEMQINGLRQEREMLLRDKVNLEENLKAREKRLMELNNGRISGEIQDGSVKLKDKIREKEDELTGVKLENQKLELSLSAMRREKADMEDEIANLKRRMSNSTEQVGSFGRNDSEWTSAQAQESTKQQEGEVSSLRREKHDLESRLFSLQRKNDELEDELASLRRKKLEVEDEISALKRDKTDSDNQVASLKKDKAELEDLITNLKRKQSDLEDSASAMKREKVELEHEISILKRHNSTMEIEVHRHYNDQQENSRTVHHKHEHVTRENISPRVTHETIAPRVMEIQYHSKDNSVLGEKTNDTEDGSELKKDASEIQKMVTDLTRQRNDLESSIKRLSDEKADLEKDLRTQLEYRRKVLHQETENVKGKDDSEASWVLRRQKDDLERSIASLKEEQVELESKVSQHNREVTSLEEKLDDLRGEKGCLEQEVRTLKYERKSVEKMVEDAKKENAAEGDYKRQVQSGIPRHKSDRTPAGNNREQQSAVLRQERDTLRTELTNLKKQFALLQTELSTKTLHFSRESIDMDEKEISELKMIRVELEREIAGLRRRKTEFEAEITVVQEGTRREENELNNLRKERMELELQNTALQSQNTRLEAEGSVLRDERNKNENEVDRLRREKADLEKDVFSLQIKALQSENVIAVEAEASVMKHKQQRYDNNVERITREKDVFSLQSESRRLEVEKADLKKEVFGLQNEKRRLNDEASALKDQQNKDEYEVERLRKEKVNLERDVFSLQSDQRRVETERSLLKDERHRDENDVERLRQEKADLERDVFSLQSDQRRVETERSKLKDERHRDENDIERLRQEKADLEKDVFSLQTEKRRLKADISTGEDGLGNKASVTTGLQTTVLDITKNLESLTTQKEDLQSEITRIQTIKERDEKELQELRREKTEMEIHLSGLRMECNREGQDRKLDAIESSGQDSWRFKANDLSRTQEQLEKVKKELQADLTKIQTLKNQEEEELQNLRQQKTQMEIYIFDLESKRGRLEMEGGHFKPEAQEMGRGHVHLTDHDKKSGQVGFSYYDRREEADNLHSYNSVSSDHYHLTSHNSEATLVSNSYSHNSHVVSAETLEMNAFRDSTFHADVIKEDNDVISLKRERSELESQICDMRTQLTRLQTEVTGLENRKTILETIDGSYASDDARNGQMNGYGAGVDSDVDFDITRAITEDKKDLLIQEYEEQIRELRQKKLELEQKASLLEWQIENMKQKLELQEIRHRREISTLNEKNQSSHGYHGNSQDDTLQEFYQKLSYFLMTGEHSNKEIMEEIEQQISNLQQKTDFDYKNTKEFLFSPSVKLEKGRLASESEVSSARKYTSQLKAQMETADDQLKTCEKIIHRLYGENTDLTKENLNLEGKLKSASRSQDKLQRKKILLQKLVDKLSGKIGKDALKQSYLVLELDKDVSI